MSPRWFLGPTALAACVALLASGCSSDSAPPGVQGGRTDTPSVTAPVGGETVTPGEIEVPAASIPLGAKWDWSRVEQFAPFLRSTRGGQTFYELVWCDVEEQPGRWDWDQVDAVAAGSAELGHSLALKLRVGACWATETGPIFVRGSKGKTESAMPKDMAEYAAFVRAAVSRYAAMGVHVYAVENEPNSERMWAGTPEQLTELVTTAARAIRAADPEGVVVDPGISSTAYGAGIAAWLLEQGRSIAALDAYQRYYARRFSSRGEQLPQVSDVAGLRAALTTDQARRNLEYLAVARHLARDRTVDVRQLHFYESWDNVPLLMAYLRAHLPSRMPIEAWEVGMFWTEGSMSEQERADEMVKVASGLLAGGVRRVTWLPLAFDPTGRHADEPRYGLLEPDGSARNTGRAFQALVRAADGASIRQIDSARVTGVAFGRGGRTTVVVWSSTGATVPVAADDAAAGVPGGAPRTVENGRVQVGTRALLVDVGRPLDEALRHVEAPV